MILFDPRIDLRSVDPVETITVEATRSDVDDSQQLTEAVENACPTVFVGRSGTGLVLSRGGSGRIVHTGVRPNAAQQAGIETAVALLAEWWPDAETPKKPARRKADVDDTIADDSETDT
jgi:hypothetical protein